MVMYTLAECSYHYQAYIQTHIEPWSCIDIHCHMIYIVMCAMQLHTWTMVIPGLYIVKFTRLCIALEDTYTEYVLCIHMKPWPYHVHFHQRAFTSQSCLWLWQSHFRHNMALQLITINTVRQTKKRRESIPQ